MPVTAYPCPPPPLLIRASLFLWTSAAETNSLQSLYTRLTALPPPAIQQVRPAKHILSYHVLRSMSSDSSAQSQTLYQVSLPHHQTDPASHFWIHDDASALTVTEMAGSFPEIMAKIDSGWQERQGTGVTLEGRGVEWGRDWRIWCANLKQANRYRGVIVEVSNIPQRGITDSDLGRYSISRLRLCSHRNSYSRSSPSDTSSVRENKSVHSGGRDYIPLFPPRKAGRTWQTRNLRVGIRLCSTLK
jgi:hypothetical protein